MDATPEIRNIEPTAYSLKKSTPTPTGGIDPSDDLLGLYPQKVAACNIKTRNIMSSYIPNPQADPPSDTVAPSDQNPVSRSDPNAESSAEGEAPPPGHNPDTPVAGGTDAEASANSSSELLKTNLPFIATAASVAPPTEVLALFLCKIKQRTYDAIIGSNKGVLVGNEEDFTAKMRVQLPGVRMSASPTDSRDEGSGEAKRCYTGLLGAFFATQDNAGMTVDDIMAKLKGSPHIVSCWRSAHGFGVDAIFKIRASHVHTSFAAAVRHFKTLGLELHASSRDFDAVTPVAADPDIWINQSPITELSPEPPMEESLDLDDDDDSSPFPMHCLPGIAGAMAKEIARVTTSQNEPLAAASVIGFISASLGAGIEFSTGGERWTRGNLYLMPIAESGTGKGEAFDLAAAPFIAAETAAIEEFNQNQRPNLVANLNVVTSKVKHLTGKAAKESDPDASATLRAELQAAERTKKNLEQQIASAPRYMVGDVTKEQLAVLMQGQPGEALASMSSEARGLLGVIRGRYNGGTGDEDFYCSGYSGDPVTFDRVGRETVCLKKPCLTAIWMVQPDVIETNLNESSMTDSGLMPRFLMFDASAEPKVRLSPPDPIPAETKGRWTRLIKSLISAFRIQTGTPISVTATPEALRILHDYENENILRRQPTGDLHDLASYVARWAENASKLALVIHCAQHGDQAHNTELDRDSAEKAVELMRWFSGKQLSLLAAGRREALEKRLADLIDILGRGDKTIRELKRSHGFKKGEVEQIHSMFPWLFNIVIDKPSGVGRPSRVATVYRNQAHLEKIAGLRR